MVVEIVTARGTGEPVDGPENMLANVTRLLDRVKFVTGADVPYEASIGPANSSGNPLGCSEDKSVADGVETLAAAIRATSNLVLPIGYSLGAVVVTRFLERQAAGEFADCELAGAAFVANPCRAAGETIDAVSFGTGINGAHGKWPEIPTFTAANPADAITSCPLDSPLRTLADGLSAFGFAQLGGWTQDLAERMLEHRFQPASFGWWLHPVATWDLYSAAARGISGYLSGKDHIHAYIDGGYCSRLAAAINAL